MAVEQVVIQLKGDATQSLMEEGVHPFGDVKDGKGRPPKCFARGEWKVFLDPENVVWAIRYVEENPAKEGKPPGAGRSWPRAVRLAATRQRSAFE